MVDEDDTLGSGVGFEWRRRLPSGGCIVTIKLLPVVVCTNPKLATSKKSYRAFSITSVGILCSFRATEMAYVAGDIDLSTALDVEFQIFTHENLFSMLRRSI